MPQTDQLIKKALRYLAIKPRTEEEIRRYLKDPQAEAVIDRLKQWGLLNDQKYRDNFIDYHSTSRPLGKRLITKKLAEKGVVLEPGTDIPEEQAARLALKKKLRGWSNLSPREWRHKATRFLVYRGFSFTTIEKVLKPGYNEDDDA